MIGSQTWSTSCAKAATSAVNPSPSNLPLTSVRRQITAPIAPPRKRAATQADTPRPGNGSPSSTANSVHEAVCCLHPLYDARKNNSGIRDFIHTVVMRSCNRWARKRAKPQSSAILRQEENLSWVDQIRVADLILVGLEDECVLHPLAVAPSGDAPQAVTGLDHHETLACAGVCNEVGAHEGG